MDPSQLTAEQISNHLANPTGDIGRAVGEFMARKNERMTKAAYNYLELNEGDRILEIGPGIGALVWMLVTNDNKVSYKGIDISETMIEDARARNADLIATGRVEFQVGAAEQIPDSESSFERIVTVNCIHFWDIPKALREIHRVLVGGGKLVVVSAYPEAMMSSDPLVGEQNGSRTNLDRETLLRLHQEAGFSNVRIENYKERRTRPDGTPYERKAFIAIAAK